MATESISKRGKESGDAAVVRERILEAAFTAFMRTGYAATTTLEIATLACVSKRDLYALVGNKQDMLTACISERARRLAVHVDLPEIRDRETLKEVLVAYGIRVLREVTDPTVIGVFRLAIAEAIRAPEVAQALNSAGRAAARASLIQIMAESEASGLLTGNPANLAEQFAGLLWQDVMIGLLLGVAERPSSIEIAERAREAAIAFQKLHPMGGKMISVRRESTKPEMY